MVEVADLAELEGSLVAQEVPRSIANITDKAVRVVVVQEAPRALKGAETKAVMEELQLVRAKLGLAAAVLGHVIGTLILCILVPTLLLPLILVSVRQAVMLAGALVDRLLARMDLHPTMIAQAVEAALALPSLRLLVAAEVAVGVVVGLAIRAVVVMQDLLQTHQHLTARRLLPVRRIQSR